jgi:hypothetical protein
VRGTPARVALTTDAYAARMQIRDRQGLFMAFAVVVILVPGIGLYAILRAVGLGIGAAGIIGLFTMFVALIVFSAWAFRGLRRG